MRELRTCPITGLVVLVDRGKVDRRVVPPPVPRPCPWCTPQGLIIATGDGVRASPHPRPVLRVEESGEIRRRGAVLSRDGLGAHEVILGDHDADDTRCLRLVQQRFLDLRRDHRLRGFRAARRHSPGHHVVWQLWALPFEGVPGAPWRWRDDELAAGERVVHQDPDAVAILAWAPRTPLETWVLPREGRGGFETADVAAVATLVTRMAGRVSRALAGAPVDLVLTDGEPWRVEIVPVSPPAALFPTVTGIPHHGGVPEVVAEYLRVTPETP